MNTASVGQRAMALSLAFLLSSCGAPRHSAAGPTNPRDLDKYAILFETQPDGTVIHTWKPISEIDLTQYPYPWRAIRIEGPLERTSSTPMTDEQINNACQQVMDACLDICRARAFPSWASHIRSRFPNTPSGRRQAKEVFCQEECAKKRNQCYADLRRQRQQAVEFTSAERAIEWIKRHKTELLVGSVVIIAAVAFVVVACGSGGCVVLIPILVVADGSPHAGPQLATPYIAEACR